MSQPLFTLGRLVSTPAALATIEEAGQMPLDFVQRHVAGDWGLCCQEDSKANDDALKHGGRIFSVYETASGERVWVITEADRSSTCLLLPSEY